MTVLDEKGPGLDFILFWFHLCYFKFCVYFIIKLCLNVHRVLTSIFPPLSSRSMNFVTLVLKPGGRRDMLSEIPRRYGESAVPSSMAEQSAAMDTRGGGLE